MSDPRKPTRAQAAAEKRLRDMGVTMTMQPHGLHPHRTPTAGCFTCSMLESMKRVNPDRHAHLPITEDADGLTCDICGAELADWAAADEHVETHEGWAG